MSKAKSSSTLATSGVARRFCGWHITVANFGGRDPLWFKETPMMAGAETAPDDFLPRTVVGRCLLLVLSIGAIAFAGTFLVVLALGRGDGTWAHWGFRVAFGEFCSALLATGLVGLVWAIATTTWLPNLAVRVGRRMAICLLIPWVLILAVVLWPW